MEVVTPRGATGRLALFSMMVAVTTVANLVMVPMPPPLAEYDLSPVLIYALGVLVSPVWSGIIIGLAQGIGTFYKAMIFGWPLVFVPGAVLVRGFEAFLIGALLRLRKSNVEKAVTSWEIAAMVAGVVWETIGFFVADVVLFGVGYAMTTLLTIVDAVYIPVAIGLVAAVRRIFGVKRLM